jgi:hypothetical protein
MTPYRFFVSDDALPVLEPGLVRNEDVLGHSALKHMVDDQAYEWQESEVKDLLVKALAHEDWEVAAARNPEFLIKRFESSLDRPDVLIFDWDYPGLPDPPEDYLEKFLSKTYCIVQIYTQADKVAEIRRIIDGERFRPYQSRIEISEKKNVNADELLKKVREAEAANFSYAFGAQLRKSTLESLEEILISLGKASLDEVMSLLNTGDTSEGEFEEIVIEKLRNHLREDIAIAQLAKERQVGEKDIEALLDLVADKLRNDLNSSDLKLLVKPAGVRRSQDVDDAAARLWSYRLFYRPSDKCVRRGDIVRRKETEEYYVVISADCDLNRLWSKNYGFVNLVPLYKIVKASAALGTRLKLANFKADKMDFTVASLMGRPGTFADGVLLLPFVPEDSGLSDFLVFPKEILSLEIRPPADVGDDVAKIRDRGLSYDGFNECERIATLSEPFSSPFVAKLLAAIGGVGVPDYPPVVKTLINSRSKASLQ